MLRYAYCLKGDYKKCVCHVCTCYTFYKLNCSLFDVRGCGFITGWNPQEKNWISWGTPWKYNEIGFACDGPMKL